MNAIQAAKPASPSSGSARCTTIWMREAMTRALRPGAGRRRRRAAATRALRSESGNSLHAPARTRRHSDDAERHEPAAKTSARCTPAPGASTRNSGIENSARSNSACSRIVGSKPKRRKIAAHSIDGTTSSTSREYEGKPG